MPPASSDPATLEDLLARAARIEARETARTAREDLTARRDDDRLTWLLGRLLRDGLATDPGLRAWVRRELPGRLTPRDLERGLWDRLFPSDDDGTAR